MSKKEIPNPRQEDYKRLKNHPMAHEIREAINRSRITRKFMNTALRTVLCYKFLTDPQIRKNPELKGFFFDREKRAGLLEDSIIGPYLFSPNQDETYLEYRSASAGRYVAFDFHRPEEFGPKVKDSGRQKHEGRLFVFALDEVVDNDPNKYTPTELLNLLTADHWLQLDHPTLEETIQLGYLSETTFGNAFKKVKKYDRYRSELEPEDLYERKVHSVTPKGNGLIFLAKDGGEKKPSTEPDRAKIGKLIPIFNRATL